MKLKFIFSAIIMSLLCVGTANSQIITRTQKMSLAKNDKKILDQNISKYTAFTIDKQELASSIGARGQIKLRIDEELDWTLNLELNDMRASNYKQVYLVGGREIELDRPLVVNTYKGYTFRW